MPAPAAGSRVEKGWQQQLPGKGSWTKTKNE
jgi:hypothetical protein